MSTIKQHVASAAVVSTFAFVAASSVANQSHAAPIDAFIQVTGSTINAIDTATGDSTPLFNGPQGSFNAAAFDPNNEVVYLFDNLNDTFFSFDPSTPSAGLNTLGTWNSSSASAGFSDNTYYAIEQGTDQLLSFDLAGASGGALVPTATQTLNLSGTGLTGLNGGDLDFIDGALVITANDVGGTGNAATFQYDSLSAISAPPSLVFQGPRPNGITFDPNSETLFGYQAADGEFFEIDQTTLMPGAVINDTDPAFTTGGDLTSGFALDVIPEPTSALLLAAGVICAWLSRRRR